MSKSDSDVYLFFNRFHLSINNWNNAIAQKTKITYLPGRLCVLMNKVKTCLSRIFFFESVYIYYS